MWVALCTSVIVMALSVYLPAYLLARGLGIHRIIALATAPIVSSCVYSLETIVYAKTGIPATWATVVLPLALAGAALAALRRTRGGEDSSRTISFGLKTSCAHCALFVIAGCLACAALYILPMGTPEALICGNDIVHHISLNRAFLETGNWSTLETATTPGDPGAFYPSLWNLFAALPMSAIGTSPLMAAHATNILIIALIFPLSSYLLAAKLFEGRPFAICMMGVLSFAFFGFPWEMFLRPTLLYPNALGFALMPGFLACLMLCFQPGMAKAGRAKTVALAFAGLCAISLAHPNSLFTAAVFAYAFLLSQVVSYAKRRWATPAAQVAAGAAFTAAAIAIWVALACAPFLHSVVSNPYDAGTDRFLVGGLARIAILKSPHLGSQAVLALLVAAGFASAAATRTRRWLAIPFATMALLYSLGISLEPGTLKSILTGFWYNHPTRVFASATMFAIPLAAEGAEAAMRVSSKAIARLRKRAGGETAGKPALSNAFGITAGQAAAGALVCLCALALPLPVPRAMATTDLVTEMQGFYDPEGRTSFFSGEERAFMQEVARTVPRNARILNIPNDGSAFAYALYGVNVSGRDFYNSETCTSASGSRKAAEIVAGDAPAQDLAEMGFTHVVVLDPASENRRTVYKNRYDESQWAGILSIGSETPGFHPVLAEGGMVLYEIQTNPHRTPEPTE